MLALDRGRNVRFTPTHTRNPYTSHVMPKTRSHHAVQDPSLRVLQTKVLFLRVEMAFADDLRRPDYATTCLVFAASSLAAASLAASSLASNLLA
jgi:hypothetical protein